MNKQLRVPTNPNTLRKMGAFDAYVQDEQERKAREEYAGYREECKEVMTSVEAMSGGIPSFEEWVADQEKGAL